MSASARISRRDCERRYFFAVLFIIFLAYGIIGHSEYETKQLEISANVK